MVRQHRKHPLQKLRWQRGERAWVIEALRFFTKLQPEATYARVEQCQFRIISITDLSDPSVALPAAAPRGWHRLRLPF